MYETGSWQSLSWCRTVCSLRYSSCYRCRVAADLTILPGTVTLNGPESYQQLLAEASLDSHQEDWTRTAQWTSSNPAIATVDQTGMVRPVADGEATITATATGPHRHGPRCA